MLPAMLRRLIETLVLPPGSALVLLLGGTIVRRWRRSFGRAMQVTAVAWLWLAATPCFGGLLLHSLQGAQALPATGPLPAAEAIVVLSAGADPNGSEYGAPVIGPITLQRLRYGVALQRRSGGLPIVLSGGRPTHASPPLAAMMARTAADEFGLEAPILVESVSADTRANARESARVLRNRGIDRVLLVTSAWHMPRAVDCFVREGIDVVPAPTAFRGEVFASWTSFVPHWTGMRDTCLAMHEWGGRLAYALSD